MKGNKEQKERVTLAEVIKTFKAYNKRRGIQYGDMNAPRISAIIVYAQSNFRNLYLEEQRSYRIDNQSGKAFFDMPSGSRSMVGNSLAGDDMHVRLDCYDWKVEYCYFENIDDIDRLHTQLEIEEAKALPKKKKGVQ